MQRELGVTFSTPRTGQDDVPGARFQRVFCDIVLAAPPRCPRAGDVSMDSPAVAVIIEDDEDIRGLVSIVLEQAGYEVHAAAGGLEGIELVRRHRPVVTTLDLSMPGIDGFETAKRIRAFSSTYIVMLTARDEEIDTVQGLQAGADDYLTKPFRPRELRARIEAMMRRPRAAGVDDQANAGTNAAGTPERILSHRGIVLDPDERTVVCEGAEIEMTRTEFDILAELLRSGRRVIGKAELALVVRGEQHIGSYVSEHDTRAIEVHVANLRRKLGESATQPRWIETVRGVGYRLTST